MRSWRLLKEEHQSPQWALAFEEAIPLTVGKGLAPNTLRFWRTGETIVIGRFQCPKLEVVLDACLKNKTSIVRRFTGGGAVYHDLGNLNFAVSMQKDSGAFSLSDFFKRIGLIVVKTLGLLGITATYKRMSVFVSNRKISGLAGMMTKEVIFAHGSLLVDSNLEILYQVLNFERNDPKKRFVPSIAKEVTTLRRELNREIEMLEVYEALLDTFENEFRTVFVPGKLTKRERELAEYLFKEKYSNSEWIFMACEGCIEKEIAAQVLRDGGSAIEECPMRNEQWERVLSRGMR